MLREIGRKALETRAGERLQSLLDSNLIWAAVIGGGVLLRLRQFQANLSFGNDEAALALNIVERSFAGLMQPLSYRQGAPILFLFIQKIFLLIFGNKDFVLEIFPFLSGCVAIFVLYRISRRHMGWYGIFAVLAFALSVWLVSYSANPKQYSSDAMIALLLVDLGDQCLVEKPRGRMFLLLGAAGAVAVWLSHPAALILPGIGLALVLARRPGKDRALLIWTLGVGVAWIAAFGVDYFASLRHLAADPYLQKYWQAYFMPLHPWSQPAWFLGAYRSLLLPSAGRTDLFIMLAWSLLLVIGVGSWLLTNTRFGVIVVLPFALLLVASALHKYPIWDRLLLFLVPFVYLLMAEGLRRLLLWGAKWNRAAGVVVYAAACVVILWPMTVSAKRNFVAPVHYWDMRPVVEYMSKNWTSSDIVFVSGGGDTFQYYAQSYGLQPAMRVVENSHRIVRFYQYRRRVQAFAGRERVWIVFAYFEEQGFQYQKYAKYLNRVGTIQDSFQAGFARAYLCKFDP